MINLYGLTISIAIFSSLFAATKLIQKKDADTLWGISIWAILLGVVGARAYHVIDYIEYYSAYPIEIFKIWNGGMGIWGAILGGLLGAVIYLRHKRGRLLPWLDIISVVTPLGQAIGRWGNFFNKEIFGTPTNLPWGITIPFQNRPKKYQQAEIFHPLFLYESLLDLALFITLFIFYKKRSKNYSPGLFIFLYLSGYALIRFFLEYLRIDPWVITITNDLILNVSQCISILILLTSLIYLGLKIKK